ncbi:hypothetical protein GCM10018787_51220 [Streptomyces thermodiastaticus]|nr:hypothetical protein GCM10018787_51220 [Streptomyces thermodiastaticus]
MRLQLQTPAGAVSYNFLYWFKHPSSLRSSGRARAAGGARAPVFAPLGTVGRPLPPTGQAHSA